MRSDTIQVFIRRDGRIILRKPSSGEPSPKQRVMRERFAILAKSATGERRSGPLPVAAAKVQALRGVRVTEDRKEPQWRMLLRSWLRSEGLAPAEIDAILERLPR